MTKKRRAAETGEEAQAVSISQRFNGPSTLTNAMVWRGHLLPRASTPTGLIEPRSKPD